MLGTPPGHDDSLIAHGPARYGFREEANRRASGAPVLLVRTMLGFDARDGRLVVDPYTPTELARLLLTGTDAFGRHRHLEATGKQHHVRLAPM